MSSGETAERVRAQGARASSDVNWDETRRVYHKGSYYALLPMFAARDMGLNHEDAEYEAGYTPPGQSVVVEEAAIIIRLPNDGDRK